MSFSSTSILAVSSAFFNMLLVSMVDCIPALMRLVTYLLTRMMIIIINSRPNVAKSIYVMLLFLTVVTDNDWKNILSS